MPRKPALTFAGALRILGRHDSEAVTRLDKLLGTAILTAGAASAVGPVGLLAALWGWVDQKNEAIGLLRGLVGSLSDRLAAVRGLERREAVIAAHTTIVAAAFFEVLEEALGAESVRVLAMTETERQVLTLGEHARTTRDYYEALYRSEVPAPSPSRGFAENRDRVQAWLHDLIVSADRFFEGLAAPGVRRVFTPGFPYRVLERYESHYLRLADKVPEFAFWSLLNENAATRHRIDALDASLQAALAVHGQALSRIQALLSLVSGTGDLDRHREGLHKANVGVLEQQIVPNDAERYDDITFPSIERAFVTPHYRVTRHEPDTSPADEDWWTGRELHRDLELRLAAYLTSSDATSLPLLLLGHPGAGKSLLMKVLAARLPPEEYTVVRVPLRNVGAGSPVIDQIQQALGAATNKRRTWETLTEDNDTVLVVLLDGLDELLQASSFDRGGYLEEVAEFQRIEGEQNRPVAVIVTSRTVVADRVDIPRACTVVKLEEFDQDQIAAWLDEWAAVNRAAIRAGTVRALTAAEALHQPHLASQPLLLLMLALYAADPAAPKLDAGLSRSALYGRIFQTFARREAMKHLTGRPDPATLDSLVREQVFRLSVAALAMFNRGVQHVSESELRADLAALRGQDEVDAGRRVLAEFFFVHAPEAVVRTTERSYEFLHATFGEYLVAQHVMGELAAQADAAYRGVRDLKVNDEVLYALTSHQAWAARRSVVEFAYEMFRSLPAADQDNVHRALTELLRAYRHRLRSTELDRYRPRPLDFVRQLATYSANLMTLALRFTDEGLHLPTLFADPAEDTLALWRSTLSLWESGLDTDSWRALMSTVEREDLTAKRTDAAGFLSFPGAEHLWAAMVGGDTDLATHIEIGMGVRLPAGVTIEENWTGWMVGWTMHALMGREVETFVIRDPPAGTAAHDITLVHTALHLLLRVRSHHLHFGFVLDALKFLGRQPLNGRLSPVTVLAVAYAHPKILLSDPKWQDVAFYTGWVVDLHVVVDHGGRKIDPELLPRWREMRRALLGEDAPEASPPGTLADLFSRFD